MSENDNLDDAPSTASSRIPISKHTSKIPLSKKTSSVPLMKETVRVTLKAADAPPATPSADMSGVSIPPAPKAPEPLQPAPSPTAKLTPIPPPQATGSAPPAKAPGAPTAGGPPRPAPTIQLRTASATKTGGPPSAIKPTATAPPVGAPTPTSALKAPGAPTSPLTPVGAPTSALRPAPTIPLKTAGALPGMGGGPTLPKATVQLPQPTQPLTSLGDATSPQSASFRIAPEIQKEQAPTIHKVLSGLGLAASILLLVNQVSVANVWIKAPDNTRTANWAAQVTQGSPNSYRNQ